MSTPPTRPSRRDLVTTGKAAEAVGVSHRSLLYWVSKGWIKPTWRSPSGRYMWSVEHLESQLPAGTRKLDTAVLDRIDEIVPPATGFNYADSGFANPALEASARRR